MWSTTTARGRRQRLSALAYDPTGAAEPGQNLWPRRTPIFKLNGVAVTKTSNSVEDVLEGVTLNLAKYQFGQTLTLTVARDTSHRSAIPYRLRESLQRSATTLKNVSRFDAASKQGAILQGDATVRSLQTQLRGILGTSVTGTPGDLTTLSSIGVAFQKDGSLAVDRRQLNDAMTNHFDEIASLFASVGKSTDSLVSLQRHTSSTKAGSYAVNVTQLATQGKSVGSTAIATPLDIVAGSNDTLDLTVDGISVSVTLAPGTYSTAPTHWPPNCRQNQRRDGAVRYGRFSRRCGKRGNTHPDFGELRLRPQA